MKLTEIHLRDPFILADNGKYYLYGTRCRIADLGFDVYVSSDLDEWSEPAAAFSRPEGFWADRNFWAPEVHRYKDAYYMFASFKSADRCRGTQILKAETPEGPFRIHSPEPVTPHDWECLDGTFYIDDGVPYMVFCHEWLQISDGGMCAIRLRDDLTASIGEPLLLFSGSAPAWARKGEKNYVTDGPFLYRTAGGRLLMIWSSFSDEGYAEGLAYSDNGKITGKWTQDDRLLFKKDGGHGMIFSTNTGELNYVLHQPNTSPNERPKIFSLEERCNSLFIK